jgi:hypothetical protein
MASVTAGDQRWVLAVDVRLTPSDPRMATADDEGVRAHSTTARSPSAGLPEVVRAEAVGRARVPPLAVVVVHPASWDDDRAARAADDVGAAITSTLGEDAAEWPWPVPLNALEASAWRALEFGLLPARGRVAVVDPGTGEAGVIDREYGRLAGAGSPQGIAGPAGDEQLVALARRVLDAAPAGPPFVGLVVGGADDAGGAGLAAVVARVTGRPPLVPGDPATVALLGGASLGWAAATASPDGPPVPRRRPWTAGREGNGTDAGGAGSGGADRVPATPAGSGVVGAGAVERTALPGGRPPVRLPRWAWWLLPLVALAVVAGAAGLLVHRQRTTPSPFTYTCPDGQVVAFRYECDRLAPSPSSGPGTP